MAVWWVAGAACMAVGVISVLLTFFTVVDERLQLRKPPMDDVPDFGVLKVREQIRTGLAWPALLAIVTGFFVSVAATYAVKIFDAWPGLSTANLLAALGSLGLAMLILALALQWMRADAARVLPVVATPAALASAMRALGDGHEDLDRHRPVLEEQLGRWESRLPLYSSGWWGIVRRAEIPPRLDHASIRWLRDALEGAAPACAPAAERRRRRMAGRAAVKHGPWSERAPYHLMWLLPVSVIGLIFPAMSWSWAAVLAALALIVLALRWSYINVHGALVARRHAADLKMLRVAREQWDRAQLGTMESGESEGFREAETDGEANSHPRLPLHRRAGAAWAVLRGRSGATATGRQPG